MKKITAKLTLKKETIADLNSHEMIMVRSGADTSEKEKLLFQEISGMACSEFMCPGTSSACTV